MKSLDIGLYNKKTARKPRDAAAVLFGSPLLFAA